MFNVLRNIVVESWLVLGQMAPYLLLGFLVAGILYVCVSRQWVERHLGGRGLGPVLKASLFGVPLPLCSCGVIPVSASLYRHGASRSATTAFLLSTPQTGVDSIAVTYALLGPVFAVFRPIAALLTGMIGGLLVHMFETPGDNGPPAEATASTSTDACCTEDPKGPALGGMLAAAARMLTYGFVTLPRDIGWALLVGVLVAGMMTVVASPDQLQVYFGSGILSILLLMAVGVPIYVCATASVPIAAGFMYMGASPGAALAFLIAGPATNAATFTTVWKVLGRRTAVLYLITVGVSAVGCGVLLDWLTVAVEAEMPALAAHVHPGAEGGWTTHAWAIGLLAVLAYSIVSPALRKRLSSGDSESEKAAAAEGEERLELQISGMNCNQCTESVHRALSECDGVESVDVDLAGGKAVVRGRNYDVDRLRRKVEELGYTVGTP